MQVLTRFVLRHRWWVLAFWVVTPFAGGAAAGQLGSRLSFDFSLPGQQGYETQRALIASYGATADAAYIPVITLPPGQNVLSRQADITATFDALRRVPGVRVVDYPTTHDRGFITDDGRSTFAVVYAPQPKGFVNPLDQQVTTALDTARAHGLTVTLTGYQQLSAGSQKSGGPSVLAETLVGGLLALAVLAFVFASFLAFLPLLIAMVSILATFLIVLGLTALTDVSFVVQFLISLVGLGVAIDYSLIVVSRWREERAHGADNHTAVVTAADTAGRAVVASGGTVAISLLALVMIPVPLLRSMGIGGMLIPLVSVAVVLTLLPVLLASVGPRIDVPRLRQEGSASRAWTAWARLVVRRRWIAAGVALLALGTAMGPVLHSQFGVADTRSLAANGPAVDALTTLQRGGVGDGVVTPVVVLTRGDAGELARVAAGVPGVHLATAASPGGQGLTAVDVFPVRETVDSNSVAVVDRVRAAVRHLPGFVGITGTGATIVDYRHAVYDNFPLVIGIIALITFFLLVRTFRSVLLPAKAVALNLLSLGAVFGAATWFWQEGHGSRAVFGIAPTGAMTFWIPPLIFAFLFGLSMDYEVFILARMREEYDATGSTTQAVVRGLGRTGRLVTSAALILFFAFAALGAAPGTDIKVFASALGAGILLDATVVRAVLVPALVAILDRWNWWLPAWLARLLRVAPSPLTPRPDAPEDGDPRSGRPAERLPDRLPDPV